MDFGLNNPSSSLLEHNGGVQLAMYRIPGSAGAPPCVQVAALTLEQLTVSAS